MKKILLALLVMGVAVASASAGVGILWGTLYGAYTHNAPNVVDDPSAFVLLDSYSVTWQLIYAGADNQIDLPSPSLGGVGISDNYVTDDDVVWATRNLAQSVAQGNVTASEDGTVWSHWMVNQSGGIVYENLAWNTAGSVFQRVFEGAPAVGSWYFQSSLTQLDTGYTGSPAFPVNAFLDTGSAGFKPNTQISIPEPATMGLLGLGALVMAIRRRRS
jgi:hypothetical protein